ncbi:hypothetical protein NEISUBOT_03215 [Neisseria subflava NJ9703]|uniref:Uncharacterized protein n=1 Tax=Neisseria subflava NJ9703 TaxID=546268 RepID=A0A9W5ISZ9_NEISU|nr:hypothetical protein NEISUBOT_03215 [Neisseria subflava NJ9703]
MFDTSFSNRLKGRLKFQFSDGLCCFLKLYIMRAFSFGADVD